MKRWIEFNIKHPRLVLFGLLMLTIPALWGISMLDFDSSVEVLMPKHDPIYKLGQRTNKIFGDGKTFTIATIEARKGEELFSREIFSTLDRMVQELEEYKDFNQELEDKRLGTLITLGNIRLEKEISNTNNQKNNHKKNPVISSKDKIDNEDELDKEVLGQNNSSPAKKNKDNPGHQRIKANSSPEEADLDKEILNEKTGLSPQKPQIISQNLAKLDEFPKPLRKRLRYNYDAYRSVTLKDILEKLDEGGVRQLNTVFRYHGLDKRIGKTATERLAYTFSKKEYRLLVESWEDIYLFKSLEIIKTLLDPVSVEDIEGSKNELKPVDLIPKDESGKRIIPESRGDFERYQEKLFKNPIYESSIYARNDKGEVIALGLNFLLKPQKSHELIQNYLWHLVNKYDDRPLKIYVLGSLIFNKFMNEYSQHDMSLFVPLVILIVMITFFLNFRNIRGMLLPTSTVIIATIWTLGLMGLIGTKLSMIGTIIPTLMIAVGSSYSIHIFNQYLQDLPGTALEDKSQVLEKSLLGISTTVMLAGLTTFIGFSTLTVNEVTGLRDFGIYAAIGTIFSVIVSVTLLSASLSRMKIQIPRQRKIDKGEEPEEIRKSQNGNIMVRSIVNFFSRIALGHSGTVLLIAVVSIILGIWGTSKVTTESTPTTYFKPGSYIRVASDKIGEILNGSFVLNLVVDSGTTNGVKDPKFLTFVQEIEEWLNRTEQKRGYNILHVTSFNSIIKRMNMAMNNDDSKYYTIPGSRATVIDYLEIFSGKDKDSDGRPDIFETMVDRDYRSLNIMVRMGEKYGQATSTEQSRRARDHILQYLNHRPNENKYSWFIVGNPIDFVTLSGYIVKGQVQTIILSILFVGIVIFILFRNLLAGLVALIPISISVIMVFGAMGFMGIPLDIAQAILSSVAIGIGVDDTIHFLNTLRRKVSSGLPLKEAIRLTHQEAGLAIVYTSVALVFGFSVLMFSSFQPVVYFGFLVSSVMAATTIGALLFLPAVIYYFKIPLDRELNWKLLNFLDFRKILGGSFCVLCWFHNRTGGKGNK